MPISLKFFKDAALTQPLTGPLQVSQNADGSTPPVDNVLYLGSTTAGRKFQADSNPGVDPISISVVDASPGSGHEASEVKLASTLAGLDSATPGAALNVGTQILSGVANAVPVYVRVDDATGTVGTATELSLDSNTIVESDV